MKKSTAEWECLIMDLMHDRKEIPKTEMLEKLGTMASVIYRPLRHLRETEQIKYYRIGTKAIYCLPELYMAPQKRKVAPKHPDTVCIERNNLINSLWPVRKQECEVKT